MRIMNLSRLLLPLVASAPLASAQQGAIELLAGETLFAEGWRAGWTQIESRREGLRSGTHSVDDPDQERLRDSRSVLLVDYGILPELTLSLLVPFVSKDLRSNAGNESSSNLGDVALAAKYLLHHNRWHGGAFSWSVVGGVELPTGKDDERSGGEERSGGKPLKPFLQSGAGATNPFLATAITYGDGRMRYDASLFVKANGEGAQDRQQGIFLSANASVGYRFWHETYPGPTAGAKLGVEYRTEGHSELKGETDVDSGSDLILLKAGVGVHPRPDIDLSFSVEVPVLEDYNGEQLGHDTRFLLSVALRF